MAHSCLSHKLVDAEQNTNSQFHDGKGPPACSSRLKRILQTSSAYQLWCRVVTNEKQKKLPRISSYDRVSFFLHLSSIQEECCGIVHNATTSVRHNVYSQPGRGRTSESVCCSTAGPAPVCSETRTPVTSPSDSSALTRSDPSPTISTAPMMPAVFGILFRTDNPSQLQFDDVVGLQERSK